MATHRIPSYRLHKPSGKAVVTLGGKDFYLGVWQSPESKSEYDRLLSEWITNGRRLPTLPISADLTVAELVLRFLEHAKAYYANDGETTSEFTCLKEAARPLSDLYSHTLVRDFGPLSFKTVRQRMVDRGWCRQHINRQVNRIRRMFKWGVENELVDANTLNALKAVGPLKSGRTVAHEAKPVTPVLDEHVDAVLPHVSRQVAAMIQLQRLTGARPGEVIQMRPLDIDRSKGVWVFRPIRHKTKHRGIEREIYLGPQAQKVLEPFLERESDRFCFSPAEAEAERNAARRKARKTPMTPIHSARTPIASPKRQKRSRYDVGAYRRAITYATRKQGIPHWHPHQLRHSCGKKTRDEFGLDVAQVVLGHKSCDVTQVYANANREKAMNVVSKHG